jgi:citrate-Mg2+:H+ or citrate-Ca2+:H+ symporter, CitMHS family
VLALAGLATILLVLLAIMSKKMSPLVALSAIPFVASLVIGNGLETATFAVQGISKIAPVAAMFMFAILYFGIMSDAGMFDPIVERVVAAVGQDPRRILIGTVVLGTLAHLDGSGATTFLIAIPALAPLYDRLQMDRKLLACAVAMAAGVANILPWGGPTIRAAAALDVPVIDLYRPLIPVQLTGLAFVFVVAYYLGVRERKRLGERAPTDPTPHAQPAVKQRTTREKILFTFNITLTIAVVVAMVSSLLQPVIAFMLGLVIALLVNYPNVRHQAERIDAHAKAALMMVSILFAAGVFTGILSGSGMLPAMAAHGADLVPRQLGSTIPVWLGFIAMPLSFLFDPDSFYLGILPVLAGVASGFGVAGTHVAQGALLGQMTTGFPVSPLTPATFLLVGLADVELGEHQRFATPFLFATSVVMTLAALLFGVFSG